jgi:glucose-1-phosphate cytidylyltransferase
VDTGLHANIGQRLVAARKHVESEDVFLANYSDGLTDMPLPAMIERFKESGKVAAFLAARPSQSFHIVKTVPGGDEVSSIQSVQDSDILINSGFFVFRRQLFEYIRPGEDLVGAPFTRLIAERQLTSFRADHFWCMDTFKEQQELTDLFNSGRAPWEVWKARLNGA